MSRKARLYIPGCLYHIMSRGIEGRDIFADNQDRAAFCSLLAENLSRTGYRCYAWALVPNHFHLVIRANEQPLWRLMKPLNTAYARHFSMRHKRRGYVFQDRYKSIATQDQLYIEELVRYVHLNPVRAGQCRTLDDLDSYQWCGHAAVMGRCDTRFQDTWTVLRRFGRTRSEARARYRRFLEDGLSSESADVLDTIRKSNRESQHSAEPGAWVIGDPSFVRTTLENAERHRVRVRRYAAQGVSLDDLAEKVAFRAGFRKEDLRRRSRGVLSRARMLLAYIANEQFEVPLVEIAHYFGTTQSAVSQMVSAIRSAPPKDDFAFLTN